MIVPVFVTIVVLLQVLEPAQGDKRCRLMYKTIIRNHTGCLPLNHECDILMKGVNKQHRDLILAIHNDMRSKLAMGKELRVEGLPEASNMNKLTWDIELQAVAEKWAEQCADERDCKKCRTVSRWSTGQNMAYLDFFCDSIDACRDAGIDVLTPDWQRVLTMFYDEVLDYDYRYLTNYQVDPRVERFTQIAWAETLKVGCGFTVFRQLDGVFRQLYVCNYGPTGNIVSQPIYKPGSPCTDCSITEGYGCVMPSGLCSAPVLDEEWSFMKD